MSADKTSNHKTERRSLQTHVHQQACLHAGCFLGGEQAFVNVYLNVRRRSKFGDRTALLWIRHVAVRFIFVVRSSTAFTIVDHHSHNFTNYDNISCKNACLPTYLPTYLPTHLPIYQSIINQSIYLSINLLSIFLSTKQSVDLSSTVLHLGTRRK